MPPRIRVPSMALRAPAYSSQYVCIQCRQASVATAPSNPTDHTSISVPVPVSRFPATQPPSHKRPEFRKTQLHRQYQSTLRSSPLIILFQHNNLKAIEWMGVRRELATALQAVDAELAKSGNTEDVGSAIKLQTIQTGIFSSALKVVEFWNPKFEESSAATAAPGSSAALDPVQDLPDAVRLQHGLSQAAWSKSKRAASKGKKASIDALLSGPVAILSFPSVSPQHVKAALSILAPSPQFPAPKRKAKPSYYEPTVQSGLQKLLMLGARVDGRTFDFEGVRWIGGIDGGLDGLRAQLVAMLSGVGAGITSALQAASTTLYVTMESRRSVLEGEQKPTEEEQKPEDSP